MYISYNGLWQLLAAKKLSKTDLCNIAGLSSRTMAKLSKNESVTTDTLLRICEALDCSLSDVAEIIEGSQAMSIYEAYLDHAKNATDDGIYKTLEFEYLGVSFCIKELKKKLNKRTVVNCTATGGVSVEHIYPNGISPVREVENIFHSTQIESGKLTVLLIPGTPGCITGLDNGVVHSARYGCLKEGFYVMTVSAFKLFEFRE